MRLLLATKNPQLNDLIKKALSRFNYDWIDVDNGLDAFQKAINGKFDLILAEFELPRMRALEMLNRFGSLENFKQPPVIVLTATEDDRHQIENEHFPKTEIVPIPFAVREFVGKIQQTLHQGVRIACLGGGTGLFTLLSGLKSISGVNLYSIVSMSDDGGSTGRLRDMFGILPPGDVRRSLVALSTAPDLLNEVIQYRFNRGGELKGHNMGNLFLAALCEMRGSMSQAVKSIGEILNIQGTVIPVTESVNKLCAGLENGAVICGEHNIGTFEQHDPSLRIARLWQEPPVSATADALEALYNANYIILGPGDLFTSIISNLIVEGVAEAIVSSKAKKIYIANVMTKLGETTRYQVSDHVEQIVKYLGGRDVLDYVLCSSSQFPSELLERYATQNQLPVIENDPEKLKKATKAKIVWADISSGTELVRHDSLKLAEEVKAIISAK